jgi:hypothetical protein
VIVNRSTWALAAELETMPKKIAKDRTRDRHLGSALDPLSAQLGNYRRLGSFWTVPLITVRPCKCWSTSEDSPLPGRISWASQEDTPGRVPTSPSSTRQSYLITYRVNLWHAPKTSSPHRLPCEIRCHKNVILIATNGSKMQTKGEQRRRN